MRIHRYMVSDAHETPSAVRWPRHTSPSAVVFPWTTQALRFTIPAHVLLQATDVIQ